LHDKKRTQNGFENLKADGKEIILITEDRKTTSVKHKR
jgi:hypothetical protein